MANNNPRTSQLKQRTNLKQLGQVADKFLSEVLDAVDQEFESPLKLAATFPVADAVLNFASSSISSGDGAKEVVSPVKKQIFSGLTTPTINFQTLALSSAAHFDVTFPVSTVGQYRIAAFTLIGSGKIKVLFSAEAATEGALSNPGALFVSGGLPLGYIVLQATATTPAFKTAGSATNIIENAKIFRLAAGGGGSSSSSAGGAGSDLLDLQYLAEMTDSFSDIPDGTTTVDITTGFTDASLHDVANEYFRLAYDASKTVSATGTAVTVSGAPTFTVKAGDIINIPGVDGPKKITVVTTQTSYTIESAWTTNPVAAAATISQAVHTVDLNSFTNNGAGYSAASQFTGNIDEVLIEYADSDVLADIIPDFGTAADVAYAASADGTNWSTSRNRPLNLSLELQALSTPTSSTQLKLRFFAAATTGSGFVNVLGYRASFQKQLGETVGSQLLSAFARPTSSITQNCSHGVSGGKSRFQFTWAYPRGLNNGEASGSALVVYANGQRVPRFASGVTDNTQAYFTEISDSIIEMDTDYSSAGIDFQFRVEKTIIDSNTQNTTRISEVEDVIDQAVDAQIAATFLTAINASPSGSQFRSDITGRVSIPNPAANLSVSMGVQRMMTENIAKLTDEFGPAGQDVFKPLNDKLNQIRFVGNWFQQINSNGIAISCSNAAAGDYVEVVFYGTGLNLLHGQAGGGYDIRVSVDGGAEGANLFATTTSAILNSRSYAPNYQIQLVSGLSQGLHTVKIRNAVAQFSLLVSGFEIITQATTLSVAPGTAFKGKYENILAVLSNPSFNSTFDSGTLGTRGGNVVLYLKSDNTVGKAVTPTNTSAAYYNSTDHTNEEVIRRYNWREFGANRTDDYSTLLGSGDNNTYFTLDDGTTTLVTHFSRKRDGNETFFISSSGGYTTFTFVGTGLDIYMRSTTVLTLTGTTLTVDGVSQGGNPWTQGVTTLKVCSGLPYGTHTVRFDRVSGNELDFADFIVYAPKKPTIPAGAVEIYQYYVMADFAANTTASIDAIAQGVLRKASIREFTYTGASWVVDTPDTTAYINAVTTRTNGSGNYFEYTFFGTGFEMRGRANTVFSATNTVSLQALNGGSLQTLTTTNFPSITASSYGGFSFNAATGNLSEAVSNTLGSGFRVSGLPLGLYKIRVTNGTANFMDVESLDIITPVHAPASNMPSLFQNTMAVGNDSGWDLRKWNKRQIPDEVQAKVAVARGVTSSPTSSFSAYTPIPEMSLPWYSDGEWVEISYAMILQHGSNAGSPYVQVFVDGQVIGNRMGFNESNANYDFPVTYSIPVYLTKGFHKIDLLWTVPAGVGTASGLNRILTVKKIANN
jgi:hypothetical protein